MQTTTSLEHILYDTLPLGIKWTYLYRFSDMYTRDLTHKVCRKMKMRTHITIIHKEFTLETLCRGNQQTKKLYHSYYILKLFKVVTIAITNNSHHYTLTWSTS